jgi:hypothetical protein
MKMFRDYISAMLIPLHVVMYALSKVSNTDGVLNQLEKCILEGKI